MIKYLILRVPRKPKDVGPSFFGVQSVAGLQGSDNDLNLSLFFGE